MIKRVAHYVRFWAQSRIRNAPRFVLIRLPLKATGFIYRDSKGIPYNKPAELRNRNTTYIFVEGLRVKGYTTKGKIDEPRTGRIGSVGSRTSITVINRIGK